MKNLQRLSLAAVAMFLAAAPAAQAAQWGSITGRFIYDGKSPAAVKVNVDKDTEVCGKHNLLDEGLTVGAGGEIKDAVIYLYTKNPAVHPDYAKTAEAEVPLDNKNCRFEPHVVVLRTTQSLVLKNSDPVGHNSKVDAIINAPINVLIPSNGAAPTKFPMQESLPMKVGCNIHPWMGAWVVVKDHPYAAVSDDKGKFEIKNLPAGTELEFVLWQEKSGYLKNAKFTGKASVAAADAKGRFKIKLKPGETVDLGDIKVSPALFTK